MTAEQTRAKLNRISVPDLDDILGRRLPVLDDGFVRVVDYMGSDQSIVQSARVSYGEGTKKLRQDRGLIRFLMRHNHTTPFEMCELKLHVRVPMDTWRQWIRHRTANVNEYSTRYSIAIDAAQRTPADQWRLQSSLNRQGSEGVLEAATGSALSDQEHELQEYSRRVYEDRLASGVAREQARKDLPLSTYTEAYWKIDLHNLFHFLQLRMAPGAQFEIRHFAQAIGHEVVQRWCPIAWEAFLDYRLNAVSLTAREVSILRTDNESGPEEARRLATTFGWLDENGEPRKNREREEFEEKIRLIRVQLPWCSRVDDQEHG